MNIVKIFKRKSRETESISNKRFKQISDKYKRKLCNENKTKISEIPEEND